MGTNYNQIDWFTNFTVVIAAGESRKISKLGRYVTILANSGADPRMQINGQNGGLIPSGLSIELPPAENFDKLEFINESVAAITMQIAISNGKIIDSRTVLSGSVEVKADPLNTPLPTEDVDLQAKIDTLIAQVDELGANTIGATNTTAATLLTPAANTTGIIIRRAVLGTASNTQAALYAATSAPSSYKDVTKSKILGSQYGSTDTLTAFEIPSGTGLYFASYASNDYSNVTVNYDTL